MPPRAICQSWQTLSRRGLTDWKRAYAVSAAIAASLPGAAAAHAACACASLRREPGPALLDDHETAPGELVPPRLVGGEEPPHPELVQPFPLAGGPRRRGAHRPARPSLRSVDTVYTLSKAPGAAAPTPGGTTMTDTHPSFCRMCHRRVPDPGRRRRRRAGEGGGRPEQRDLPRVQLHQGPRPPRDAHPSRPVAALPGPAARRLVQPHPGRAGDGRDRGAARRGSSRRTGPLRSPSTAGRSGLPTR